MVRGRLGSMIFTLARDLWSREATVTVSGKSISLKEGEMVIMPAYKPHALQALEKFKMLLIMIRT